MQHSFEKYHFSSCITPSLLQLYYTDGLNFHPLAATGTTSITEANDQAVRGTTPLYFAENYNGV
ncbi:MAG: hypothetical protein WKF91_20500 [Segetibacter sp.]